ncbi:hypothetical protein, partial [Yersinia pseudotuberculosis]|uniref:hypothetical protein n=1 Tax=Yersinia pseudotuberculosis TaxID=633 RepID=UPI001E4F1D8B
ITFNTVAVTQNYGQARLRRLPSIIFYYPLLPFITLYYPLLPFYLTLHLCISASLHLCITY